MSVEQGVDGFGACAARASRWAHPALWRRRGLWLVALASLGSLALPRCERISQEEILCEEAVAKLYECCGYTKAIDGLTCKFADASGGCLATRPQVSSVRATCLLERSCQQLRENGTCEDRTWTPAEICSECSDRTRKGPCCLTWKEPLCR